MTTMTANDALNAFAVELQAKNADLLAALKEIDSIATRKQAKALARVQQVARAAIGRQVKLRELESVDGD
jgi:hypothetical protein